MSDAAILDLRDVGVTLSGRAVVRSLTATLAAGRLVAVLGPNGAGKTTVLRALAGLVPHTGAIRLAGRPVGGLRVEERARALAYLPQGHQVHWPLPARDVVALGRYAHGARDPRRLPEADARAVDEALARMDCLAFAERDVQTLSGGERARVMLARALAAGAPVLLADEPTAALDPRHQLAVMEALRAEARRGAAVVAVTHDLLLAARFADEVLLLDGGRLAAHGPPAAVLDGDRLRQVYGVVAEPARIGGLEVAVPWSAA